MSSPLSYKSNAEVNIVAREGLFSSQEEADTLIMLHCLDLHQQGHRVRYYKQTKVLSVHEKGVEVKG